MRFPILWAAVSLMLSCGSAQAAWQEASSDHFVIYADDTQRDITTFAQQLERYHAGLAFVTSTKPAVPSPSNRVTVFVVRNEREVRALYGKTRSDVAGFYLPRAGASVAIVPAVNTGTGSLTWSMLVLLHEYAHHFLISADHVAMPRWMNEGGAEFFASAQFEKDGSMWLGRPATHRAVGLTFVRDVTATDLLDPARRDKRIDEDAFYGKSWLLYHYLTFEPSRKGQLSRYIGALAGGKGLREAAVEAFGDLGTLEQELDRYQVRRKLTAIKLAPESMKFGPVRVRALSQGEAAIMPVRIRSRKGVAPRSDEAAQLLTQAKPIAAQFPTDAAVLAALAECEYDAGHNQEAIAAADAAIKLDPRQVDAFVQKGLAQFRQAPDAENQTAAYKNARATFVALNKVENDHPLPLFFFYQSYAAQGIKPPPLAIDGLIRAVELAPFDMGLRMNLGLALLQLGRGPEATIVLKPIAYHPHGGQMATAARDIVDRIAKEPTWKGEGLAPPTEDERDEADAAN